MTCFSCQLFIWKPAWLQQTLMIRCPVVSSFRNSSDMNSSLNEISKNGDKLPDPQCCSNNVALFLHKDCPSHFVPLVNLPPWCSILPVVRLRNLFFFVPFLQNHYGLRKSCIWIIPIRLKVMTTQIINGFLYHTSVSLTNEFSAYPKC